MCTFFIFGLSAIRRATLYTHVLCEPSLMITDREAMVYTDNRTGETLTFVFQQ